MPIPVVKEGASGFGARNAAIIEDCFLCGSPTRLWYTRLNHPVCETCAGHHEPGDVAIRSVLDSSA